jgi:hypothetical protein
VAAAVGHDLRLGIAVAFGIAAAVGLVALAVTRRLPSGPSSVAPPPVAEQTVVRHQGSS